MIVRVFHCVTTTCHTAPKTHTSTTGKALYVCLFVCLYIGASNSCHSLCVCVWYFMFHQKSLADCLPTGVPVNLAVCTLNMKGFRFPIFNLREFKYTHSSCLACVLALISFGSRRYWRRCRIFDAALEIRTWSAPSPRVLVSAQHIIRACTCWIVAECWKHAARVYCCC